MKFGDLFLVHIGLPVDSALVAELSSERQIIKNIKGPKKNNMASITTQIQQQNEFGT